MQIAHAQDASDSKSFRGQERQFRALLTGNESRKDNFRLYLVHQVASVNIPRHKHNFDQVRMCLEGEPQNYGPDRWIQPGELVYFPEGTPYGPEVSDSRRLSITLQFGGASGSGFIGAARLKQAMQEMMDAGTFEKGKFKRVEDGQEIVQDAFEAAWEHVNERALLYPEQRYGDPVHLIPGGFVWSKSDSHVGFDEKRMAVFPERSFEITMLRLAGGSEGRIEPRPGIQVGFLTEGEGNIGSAHVTCHSAFSLSPGETMTLRSAIGISLVLFRLPIFESDE